jgi:hypothetical protein
MISHISSAKSHPFIVLAAGIAGDPEAHPGA